MTVTLPDLQIGLAGTLYLMAAFSFFICWAASMRASSVMEISTLHGFWKFIAILSGCFLVALFIIATLIMIVQRSGSTPT